MRKDPLTTGETYHVFTRSIANFQIFNNDCEFSRMREVVRYYQREKPEIKFSRFIHLVEAFEVIKKDYFPDSEKLVEIIAYCFMPTHVHLVLKQLKQNGISIFMNNVLNSYTRYFNTKHNRKGPLWEARFKSVLVESDEYLLHLTRYIHLNPVTATIVNTPETWNFSSYQEYLSQVGENRICHYEDVLKIDPHSYKQFVDDRISYQKELALIKDLLLEQPTFTQPPVTLRDSHLQTTLHKPLSTA